MTRNGTMTLLMTFLLTILLVTSLGVASAAAEECCAPCHGYLIDVHGDFNHTAAPGNGPVVLFDDFTHDDAWWGEPSPQFDVTVDCTICHNADLPLVHGSDCSTCHPTPYDTVKDVWGKGCQQGGCHTTYHGQSTVAHLPFENAYDSQNNDCNRCHGTNWQVTQAKCLNCHASNTPDTTPPTTTSDVQGEYFGIAQIGFSITDNGKVGVGRTFYQLDGGPATPAGKFLVVTDHGEHDLVFWSKDQYGNLETTPHTATFTVTEDNTPPTTTSNAQPSYLNGAVILLNATDDGSGVKETYYTINGGSTQTGTKVTIPGTSGTFTYTLAFWSEDLVGNIEDPNTVTFTVTSGGGTLQLVWADSDVNGSPCTADPCANAVWTVKKGTGIVATGSGGCPNWSGVDLVAVPVSSTPYSVVVDWWFTEDPDDCGIGFDDQTVFSSVNVSTPGEIIRLSY